MVGAAFACLLAEQGPEITVTVLDVREPPGFDPQGDYRPRVSAISRASARILGAAGAWREISRARVSPYREMYVWDAGHPRGAAGTIRFGDEGGAEVDRLSAVGMVSPYLQMYDEFSAEENLSMALSIRGLSPDLERVESMLESVGLHARRRDLVRTYSSGMKQSVKYAFALIHGPSILMLDEPMANLDAQGIAMLRRIMEEHRASKILVVATNNLSDVETYDQQVNLDARPTH